MLNEILTTDVYRFMLLFVRMGTALMVMPGLGGQRVPQRVQLLLGLSIAFVMLPVLGTRLPAMPRSAGALVLLVGGEVVVGVFMGTMMQMILSALHVAGTAMGFQIGLTNAFSFDVVAEQQSSVLTSFLTTMAVVVLFATNLHHLMLRAVVDSYDLFPAGTPLPLGDFSDVLTRTMTSAFVLGLKLAAPMIAFGLIFYAGLGLLSRLVPQMQVFFVGLPIQMMAGLWMLMVSLPVIFMLFDRYFEDTLVPFLTPR